MEKLAKQDIVIPPLRNTLPLAINPEEIEKSELARKQLESLNKIDRKKRNIEVTSSETRFTPPVETSARLSLVSSTEMSEFDNKAPMHNLSSSIISKAELEDEIRKKVAKQESPLKKVVGTIEIPQELILSGLNTTTPSTNSEASTVQLHDQELIDILEGKSGDEMYEVITEDGQTVFVKDLTEATNETTTSYEIISGDSSVSNAKAKLLEREIAMRQIASLPVRKNKRPYAVTPIAAASSSRQTIAQTLAADWGDDEKEEDEMILEVVNMQDVDGGEPQIKILNMTILNEAAESKPKVLPTKTEPKVLNRQAPPKIAPKILNINASAAAEPATFKRGRVIKKKEIWDPSANEKTMPTLPPSITIKKLTKDSIAKSTSTEAEVAQKLPLKKSKKRSEIDKLLQDEGAVNMIYSLERENNNEDVPEIEVKPDQKSLIDKSLEKSSLVTKAKAIKNVVMKQSSSPTEAKPSGRIRVKREVTPVKPEDEPTIVVLKAQKTPSTAGRKKKVNDNSWDYIYSQAQATCDDAMIIRRRSNSSYSSSAASPRRLSVDINESPPPSAKKLKEDSKDTFEFTKPPTKNTKSPADKVLNKDFVDELRGKISNVITKNKEKNMAPTTKGRKRAALAVAETSSTPAKRASERRSNGSDHKEYRLVKSGKVAHIILAQNPLTISLLSEMKSVLNQLETDECEVVLITSSEGFSEGLDYSALAQSTVDKRKQAASELVTAFK